MCLGSQRIHRFRLLVFLLTLLCTNPFCNIKQLNDVKKLISLKRSEVSAGDLVECFGFNGPLRQYFSLYHSVSRRKRERERGEKIEKSKTVQTTPIRTYCKRNMPLSYYHQKIVGRPGTGCLPRTIATPDHPVC